MGHDVVVPLFDACRIGAALSPGPSRIRRLSRPKQHHPVAAQRALRIESRPRDTIVNVLSLDLLFALAVMRMMSAEKGPCVMLNKLVVLRDKLTGKMEALWPGETARGLRTGMQAAFVAAYNEW